ncbi:MAG: hypothetical protein ACOYMF_05240 [Bacteroidales bacterium]
MRYFRNTKDLLLPKGDSLFEIEEQSLWKLIGDELVLYDDDFYMAIPLKLHELDFKEVLPP